MKHLDLFEQLESKVRYYCRETPNLFATARGAKVWDADGVEFIDFLSGSGSLNYGHNHPAIKRAVVDYLLRDGIGNALDFHTEAKHMFMARFRDVILEPRGLPHLMQFTGPTGANCVEAALKLARKYTGRSTVVAFSNAFHGMSAAALAATGSLAARRALADGLQDVYRLPFDGYGGAGIAELERFAAMARDPSGGIPPVAAFIVESVQGEGGLNVASADWLRSLRTIATSMGALLIVDDIQAGCGRTGDFFSFERAGIVPDLICLSKSISGLGLPMSVLLLAPEFDIWQPAEHNGTFRGNSLAFIAAVAALDLWDMPEFRAAVHDNARLLQAWLTDMERACPDEVRRKGLGMMAGLEFRDPAAAAEAAAGARRANLLIETCGSHDQVLKILAPLTIEPDLLAKGLEKLRTAISAALLSRAPAPQSCAA